MNKRRKAMRLVDMDVGLFISYELTAESITTKLFRLITLNTIPLNKVMDLREADEKDVTRFNRINWFRSQNTPLSFCPVYTLQTAANRPRIFMRLRDGSHLEMKKQMSRSHAE